MLSSLDFKAFFSALWRGREPFPWQLALARRVLGEEPPPEGGGPWPQAITLPTASGKTACMDVALFALAAQAPLVAEGPPLTAPRRIFFVVDRRVIVDEAYERAARIATALQAADDGILRTVADRLRQLAGSDVPLTAHQLRGGTVRDDAWARSPLQPAVIACTVDQLGSRLLFRGYGCSMGARPLHAALTANDSLVLLDEAHCSRPFLETLQAIARYRILGEERAGTPFLPVVMTATPPAGMDDRFPPPDVEAQDRQHPILRDRYDAPKPCRLVVAEKATGRRAGTELAAELVRQALAIANSGPSPAPAAIAVLSNRVATAREACGLLQAKGHDAVLLVGRMRPLDKDDTVQDRLAALSADVSADRVLQRPLFVVSTQTLEVGANLDFDAMVSECAALDALRQRFGRLNRMGRPIPARGVIVVRADQVDADDDPVYGVALAATWAWLQGLRTDDGTVDFGVTALGARLAHAPARCVREPPHAPVLLPSHLDALVQTAPTPTPEPDVSLFLHGPRSGAADVQVCWRADLRPGDDDDAWLEAVVACPPGAAECMPVPFGAFRSWLTGATATDGSDVEGVDPLGAEGDGARRVIRWAGREDSAVTTDPADVHPGDLVVVPVSTGGWEAFGHLPDIPGRPLDLGDRAWRLSHGRAVLRITPGILASWPPCPARERLAALAGQAAVRWDDEPDALLAEVGEALILARDEVALPVWIRELVDALLRERSLRRIFALHPGGFRLPGRRSLSRRAGSGAFAGAFAATAFTDDDDARALGTVPVALADHQEGVSDLAHAFGKGVRPDRADDLVRAARWHDLGKADPRFQALLRGGRRFVAPSLLAKSGSLPQGRAAWERATRDAGLPRGFRHELLSVRLLRSRDDLLGTATDPDLVLHLIAAHHGRCRPFAPPVSDPNPVRVRVEGDAGVFEAPSRTGLEQVGSGVAERFWVLVRRYGWWGLAELETLLRLADHRCSEEEEHRRQELP